jgi:hypothetical protein
MKKMRRIQFWRKRRPEQHLFKAKALCGGLGTLVHGGGALAPFPGGGGGMAIYAPVGGRRRLRRRHRRQSEPQSADFQQFRQWRRPRQGLAPPRAQTIATTLWREPGHRSPRTSVPTPKKNALTPQGARSLSELISSLASPIITRPPPPP